MLKKSLSFVVVFCIALLCHSQTKLPENMFLKKLPNGLDVLVVEDNTVPLATIELAVKNGSYTETPDINGLSHLYEHMFFKANKDYPDQLSFFKRVQQLGIVFNGSTHNELVNYYFTLPAYNLSEGLKFMNTAIRFPSFDQQDLKKENIVVDGEFQRKESNPSFALFDAMDHHMWGESYSRKNVIGNHEVIRNATHDQMEKIKNRYYWPNNSLLIVAGKVLHEDVFTQVGQVFGDWVAAGFDPFVEYPVPEIKPLEKSDYIVVKGPNVTVPLLLIEWQGPDTRNDAPGTYIADIFSTIVNQHLGKLQKALINTGLAQQVDLNYLTQKYAGPISLFVVPNPAKMKECLAEINRQIEMFDADDYFTDAELAIAKRHMEIRELKEEEATSEFVHTLSFWWCSTSLEYFTNYLSNMNNVTRGDLQNYVRKYIKNKPHCAGLLINPTMEASLNPAAFFKP